MKKTLFTFAVMIFCAAGAVAQTQQGLMLVSGSVGFNSVSYEGVYDGATQWDATITTFELTPRVGYFVTDALAVGAGLEFSTTTTKEDEDKLTESGIAFAPFARYYLPQGLFGEAEVGFGSNKTKAENEEVKSKIFQWSVGVGYAIFLNDNVALEPLVSYGSRTDTNSEDTKYKDKFSGIGLNIGLSVYLGR